MQSKQAVDSSHPTLRANLHADARHPGKVPGVVSHPVRHRHKLPAPLEHLLAE